MHDGDWHNNKEITQFNVNSLRVSSSVRVKTLHTVHLQARQLHTNKIPKYKL